MEEFAHIDDVHRRIFAAMLGNLDASVGEVLEKLRAEKRTARGQVKDFDLGPELDEILARAEDETGLKAPALQEEPLAWATLESAEDAMKRVRSKAGI